MKRLGNHLKLHYLNIRKSFLIFWAVVLGIVILNLALAVIFSADQVPIGIYRVIVGDETYQPFVVFVMMSVYIYMFLEAPGVFTETYGFVIGLGSTRKHYYLGLIAFFLLLAAAMAVVLGLLFGLVTLLYKSFELEQVNFLQLFQHYQGGSGLFPHMVFYFSLLAAATALRSTLNLLYYRNGKVFWLYVLVAASTLLIFPTIRQWAWDFILFFALERSLPLFTLKMLGLTALLFLCGWPVVRKAAVRAPAGS